MAGVIVNVAGTVLQAPLRVVPLAALLVVNNVVPKPLNGVLRFVLFLGQRRVRKLAGSRLRVEDLQLAGPLLGVIDSLAGPAAVLSLGRPLLRTLAPPVWRMGIFYRHMVPLLLGRVLANHPQAHRATWRPLLYLLHVLKVHDSSPRQSGQPLCRILA